MSIQSVADHSPPHTDSAFARDVIAGLTAEPKWLWAKHFYDEAGSRLFERITQVAEYYPTRTELSILRENAARIAGLFPPGAALVEFGAGSSIKARILLSAATSLSAYIPVDISAEFLQREAAGVARDYRRLDVIPVATDFTQLFALPSAIDARPRVGFFPGSTIGNFDPEDARAFLARAKQVLGDGALMLVGVDLEKDEAVLNAAYNDAAGVTAAFNMNLLRRINRELGANIPLGNFEHRAFYNAQRHRIEMHLVSRAKQQISICGQHIAFAKGETIHSESSYKYTVRMFSDLAASAGWKSLTVFTDAKQYFSLHVLKAE
ncbi:MAG: hypothetical protein QOD74_2047 [Variibacter sp.]|nr:hypothetical protein [Variibacter sp.]